MRPLKYPKGELVWLSKFDKNGELVYIITSKPNREFYYLYEVVDCEFKRFSKSRSPLELEAKYNNQPKE